MTDDTLRKNAEWTANLMVMCAYQNSFLSNLEVVHDEQMDRLLVFNTRPYANDPGCYSRGRDLEEFRSALAEQGIRELAFSAHPTEGDDAYHTYVMVIDASVDRIQWVESVWQQILYSRQYPND